MIEIIPAILEKDFNEIKNKLTFLHERVKSVHIDIQDGIFTEKSTWPFGSGGFDDIDFRKIINEEEGLPFWQEFNFEFDLMVSAGGNLSYQNAAYIAEIEQVDTVSMGKSIISRGMLIGLENAVRDAIDLVN
ncbi:MAG: pyridoxine 5'-phosphate synthase [Candidatus Marinimicrobia bacterium]|nr:pyridoxine 5'-phosphate synthase [Candidatus Neomarinimicrobiota bacterium]